MGKPRCRTTKRSSVAEEGRSKRMKPLVLIGAKDVDFYLFLSHVLEAEGFETELADSIEEIFTIAAERQPCTIVLDCQPDSLPVIETYGRLKEDGRTKGIPVVALIGPGAEREHVQLLKSGVEDVFTRPVLPGKLLERIRGRLDDSGPARPAGDDALLTYADVELDLDTYRVRRKGREIRLGPIEFRLLRHFMQSPGLVFTRDELISAAWKENVHVGPRTVDVHVGLLRRALKAKSETDLIRTVRSVGYAMTDEPEAGEGPER